jgi:hypothetical protein
VPGGACADAGAPSAIAVSNPEITNLDMDALPEFLLFGRNAPDEAVRPARAEHRASAIITKQKCSPGTVHHPLKAA